MRGHSTLKSVTISLAGPVAETPWPTPSPPPRTKPTWSAAATAWRKAAGLVATRLVSTAVQAAYEVLRKSEERRGA